MEVGVQCNLWSDQRSLLVRIEDRIIESQKNLFSKTEKMFKSQNEKIVKLTKLVDVQNETIGTLDARLEIIYRFLNKEIKDMEKRLMASFDTTNTSFTNQFVHSLPYALRPAMEALAKIQNKIEVLCSRETLDKSDLPASELDIACSDTHDPVSDGHDVPTDPVSEISENNNQVQEFVEERDDLSALKSEENDPIDEILEVNSNIVTERESSINNESGSSSHNSGLKFILNSLGLPGTEPVTDEVKVKEKNKTSVSKIDHKNLKRKHEEDSCDSVPKEEAANTVIETIESPDLEDGEIVDDDQEITVVPIGRVTVRTSGIFKDETRPKKKRKSGKKGKTMH